METQATQTEEALEMGITPHPRNIHTALLQVYKSIGYVQKTKSKDGGLKYAYAGEAALIEALRPAMIDAGIVVQCVDIADVKREVVKQTKTANGSTYETTQYFTTGLFTFRFMHAESGTFVDAPALGEGYDSLDKGAYKAMTGALKYALRQTFLIETGDDPDKYQEEPEPTVKASTKAKPAPKQAANQQEEALYNKHKTRVEQYIAKCDAFTSMDEFNEYTNDQKINDYFRSIEKSLPELFTLATDARKRNAARLMGKQDGGGDDKADEE